MEKRVTKKPRSIFNAFLIPMLSLATLTLISFVGLTISFEGYQLRKIFLNRNKEMLGLFTQSIAQDLVNGSNAAVYNKCKTFFTNQSILRLTVPALDGSKTCDFQRGQAQEVSLAQLETIYFDERKNIPASTVSAQFDTSDLNAILMSSAFSYAVAFAVLALGQCVLMFRISRFVTKPILEVTSHLKRGDLNVLQSLQLRSDNGMIEEISQLSRGLSTLAGHTLELQSKLVAEAEKSATAEVARQVSHDIRSPLSALNMVLKSLEDLPEQKRLIIRNATQRINDIANGLLQRSKDATQKSYLTTSDQAHDRSEPVMLVALLDAIVSEKRVQFREKAEVDIQCDMSRGYGLFAHINSSEFARSISNLINNSVEAFTNAGYVNLAIVGYKKHINIVVQDNGKGIPAEILDRFGEKGVTHGKEGTHSGSGLGVYYARSAVIAAGGRFAVQSQLGVGTQITITLPKVDAPLWFVRRLKLHSGTVMVSIDDDQTIHQIWSGKLSSAGSMRSTIQHLTFSSLEQFENWISPNRSPTNLFLIDYEFINQTQNGLDIIERLSLTPQAILVTSRYEEPHVRHRAESLGV